MVIFTCPKCGSDLDETLIGFLPCRFKRKCLKCGWEVMENKDVVRISYNRVTEGEGGKLIDE